MLWKVADYCGWACGQMACHHLAVAACLFAFYVILVLVNLLPFILG
jgi:hypothetical protein